MSVKLTLEYTNSPGKFLDKHWLKSPTNIPGLPAKYRDLQGAIRQEDQFGNITPNPVADDKARQDDCLELIEFGATTGKIVHCDIDQMEGLQNCQQNFSSIVGPKPHVASFRAYCLPWQQNRITYVTLEDPNTSYFFTSSLSGCSIFVTGTWERPTVYHANARNIGGEQEDDKRQEYMNELFRLASINKKFIARLTKADYRPDDKIQRKRDQGRTFVKRGEEDQAFAEDTTVIGFKKSGKWQFYFQLNIYMEFARPRSATFWGAKKDFQGYKSYSAPLPKI